MQVRVQWFQIALVASMAACASGDSSTAPVTVSTVAITSPTTAPTLQTVGRTVQLTAAARSSASEVLPGIAFGWTTSNAAVATVSGTGLVTAVANGTAQIRASALPSGVQSAALTITVEQFAAGLRVSPTTISFGALGSTRQLVASLVDSSEAALPGMPATTWSRVGPGSITSVSAAGLVTALAVGTGDSAVATVGARTVKVPVTVSQVVANIVVTNSGRDTLATTGRTTTYAAAARDSNTNVVPGQTVAWSSTDAAVASVNTTTGIATAVGDGATTIRATIGSVVGQRQLTVRRFASTFSLSPSSISITTQSGTAGATGTARDSLDTNLPITWLLRSGAVASLTPSSGASTTVTAAGNGSTFLVMAAGTRTDSASVTVSGQSTAPLTAGITVGDNFFRSVRNTSQNAAVDTVAVGGTVTWTFSAANLHNVQSIFSPSFTSSALMTTGTYVVSFPNAGTYQYDCQVHSSMTGRIVVR